MAIMEFVQRFQALELQRDTGNELIKVSSRLPSTSYQFPIFAQAIPYPAHDVDVNESND
jgi:hypothetical protein